MARKTATLLIGFCSLFWSICAGLIVYAGEPPSPGKGCPQPSDAFKVSLVSNQLKGRVGIPLSIPLNITPFPAPPGFFYTSTVDVLESPGRAKPEIQLGVPDIELRCEVPGGYRLRVRVNLIEKSSCGGVKARTLKEQEIQILITQ